jgi:uncharacterized membrane protein YvbJ
MGQKFCTVCGAVLSEEVKFCESCGTPVTPATPALAQPLLSPIQPEPLPLQLSAPTSPTGRFGKMPVIIITGIVIVLIIAEGVFVLLPKISDS